MIATNGDLDIQKTERKGKTPYKTKGYETLRIKISFFDWLFCNFLLCFQICKTLFVIDLIVIYFVHN